MTSEMTKLLILSVAVLYSCTAFAYTNGNDDESVDFTNHKVIRITPKSLEQVAQLRKLENDFEMDYWNPALDDLRSVLTIVDPEREHFLYKLNRSSISYEVLTNNYQEVVNREQAEMRAQYPWPWGANLNPYPNPFPTLDFYEQYHTYDEIMAHMKSLAEKNPTKVTYGSVGKSYEGREIPYVKIGNSGPVLFVECGIHSREWVTVAFGTWLSNELVTNANLASYTDRYQIIIVPVLNVDGYVFTHTSNRLWRKTRSRQSGTSCLGADPNRNWDSAFCKTGASTNPCSETYCGKSAFSEVEALQMSQLINQYKGNIGAYFAVHSYSQLWMYPWGYTYSLPSNSADLNRISSAAVNAIKSVNGLSFTYGSIANTIYLASGSSADWAYDVAGVKVSFAVELRDKGEYGFNLPANQIKPACLETWAGVKAAIDSL